MGCTVYQELFAKINFVISNAQSTITLIPILQESRVIKRFKTNTHLKPNWLHWRLSMSSVTNNNDENKYSTMVSVGLYSETYVKTYEVHDFALNN